MTMLEDKHHREPLRYTGRQNELDGYWVCADTPYLHARSLWQQMTTGLVRYKNKTYNLYHLDGIAEYVEEFRNSDIFFEKFFSLIYSFIIGEKRLQEIAIANRGERRRASLRAWVAPSPIALKILTFGQSPARAEEAVGDITELFQRTVERHGRLAAQIGLWFHACSIPAWKGLISIIDWVGRLLLVTSIWKFLRF